MLTTNPHMKYIIQSPDFHSTGQKRGYSSLNGIVTVISIDTGKAIYYEVMVKKCAQCTLWESRKGTVAYNEFMADQDNECLTNHKGSAGMMEPQGVVACFTRSLEKYKTPLYTISW